MKRTLLFVIFLILTAVVSCTEEDEIKISPDNLTSCPKGSDCDYLYTEYTNLDSMFRFREGDYRLFWNKQVLLNLCPDSYTTLWIKAPMKGNSFLIGKEDIRNGFVLFHMVSPCALFVPLKPVGGYISGVKIDNANLNNIKWLLDINVVLGMKDTGKPMDTIKIKQYFYPNFVFD